MTVAYTLTVVCDAHHSRGRAPDCRGAWAAEGATAQALDVEREKRWEVGWTRVFRRDGVNPPAEPAEEYWRDVCPACAALDDPPDS